MGDGDFTGQLGEIRSKLELLRRLAAENGSGVVIEDPATLEPVPELPAGVTEVFGMFRRIEGSYFRFVQPAEVSGPAAWAAREINPEDPMGNPLVIGYEIHSVPSFAADDIVGGDPIRMDAEDGGVYYLEPDDYVMLYENPDEDVEIEDFAGDIVTFFNEFVLGDKYPFLVETVLGSGARNDRDRNGEYTDTWMRLLVRAGLAA
ncbi:hypothetical protein ACI2K4_14975 [Micromonospora sp. NPDC050397]|uniref:hypothetical protein n=1 Tax=Micromonospora sp. NPDC050397 TaxID=3364279 RepID=UPI00384EC306